MSGLFLYLIIFIFGTVIGSFLNCVIYRLRGKENFLKGRSCCPYCKHKLSAQNLIPIFSFLILKGKCRYCQKPISLQYPLVEFFTGILFVLIFYHTIYNIQYTIYELAISCFLIVIFVYDLRWYIIPDKIIYPAIAATFLYQLFGHWGLGFHSSLVIGVWDFIWPAFLASAFFLSIVLVSRGRWMGVGDIKLAFLMGLLLGFPNILVALFFGFFIGAIIGIGLILARKKTLKSEVPFGPFLVTGTFIALFWGERIVNWYLSLFL